MAPQIDSLSNHRIGVGDSMRSIFVRGSGFQGATGVQVGDQWAEFIVDGDEIITVTLPHLLAGTTQWVIVHTPEGPSPCVGDAQLITVDDLTDVPPAALRIDEMVPPTIDLGRADTYWLLGTGLSQVTMAGIGATPCPVESYDDTRLMLHIPQGVEGAADGATVELQVFSPAGSATLNITCTAPLKDHEEGWPVLTSIEPNRLGVEGGRIVVQGVRLDWVSTVVVGDISCTIESTSEGTIYAMVPSLEGHRGETLAVTVIDPQYASPAGSVAITVE
ncbi:MAG: IPT/TIG domain-containing protein [Acidimicrobiales bacterium]